jgi:hypothetical protein
MGKRFSLILRILRSLFCILAFVVMSWCLCGGINLTLANYFVFLEVKFHPIAQTEIKICPKLKFPYLHLTTIS